MAQESKAAEAQSATACASSRVVSGLVVLSSSAGQRRSATEAAAGVTFSFPFPSLSPPPSPCFSTLANKAFQASRTFPEHASDDPPFGPASSVTVAAKEPASNSGVRPP